MPEAGRNNLTTVKAEIMKGNYSAFKGPLKDNKGTVVVPDGTALPETAIQLESCNYLVEGINGSIA